MGDDGMGMGMGMADAVGDVVPELVLLIGAVVVLLAALFLPRRHQSWAAAWRSPPSSPLPC